MLFLYGKRFCTTKLASIKIAKIYQNHFENFIFEIDLKLLLIFIWLQRFFFSFQA